MGEQNPDENSKKVVISPTVSQIRAADELGIDINAPTRKTVNAVGRARVTPPPPRGLPPRFKVYKDHPVNPNEIV